MTGLMTPILTQFPITRWPLLMAGVSLALLLGAWGFQYIGHYDPCALCYDQRHIHMAVIALGLASGVALGLRPELARFAPWVILAIAAVLVYSAGFAFWHAGIEYDWWAGPETCTATGGASVSVTDVLAALDGCDGVLLSRLSGSGATCFGLFADEDQAAAGAEQIRKHRPNWWVQPTRILEPGTAP